MDNLEPLKALLPFYADRQGQLRGERRRDPDPHPPSQALRHEAYFSLEMMNADTGMAEALEEESDFADIEQLDFDLNSCQSSLESGVHVVE